jgi:ribosome assembly protein 4
MATLLPPPKRVKLTHGTAEIPEVQKVVKEPAPSVVVQFVSDDDGQSLGPAISLPADLNREALETLVNNLKGSVRSFRSGGGSFY